MATIAVACAGDVEATPGTVLFDSATAGSWVAAEQVEETTINIASYAAAKVVVEASCTFTFSGTNSAGTVNGTSTVTLQAGNHSLTLTSTPPLVDGNSKQDKFGNTLTAKSVARLRTQ